jgi:hypothetical protein
VTPCAVCTMHVETMSVCFLVEHQKQGRRFVSGLALKPLGQFVSGLALKPLERFVSRFSIKTTGTVSPDFTSKPVARVFRFGPQNRQVRFGDLGLKITVTVFWFGH